MHTRELFHSEPGLSDQRSKASVRRLGVSKNDVATVLLIKFISHFSKCPDCVATGHNRQLHPPATSMTSSTMLGGNGLQCFWWRLFK